MFWLYYLPTWLMGTLIIGVYCTLAFLGGWLVDQHLKPHESNHLVSDTLRSVIACYSILMGLTAVTTWNNFKDVQTTVAREASASAEVYRACAGYEDADKVRLRGLLRTYVRIVLADEWPAQQQGQLVAGADAVLQRLQQDHQRVAIINRAESYVHEVATAKLQELVETRRQRRNALGSGLHPMMWFVALLGSVISIGLSFFYSTKHRCFKHAMSVTLAGMIGLMIFWVLALDRPLLGDVSVRPDRFQEVLQDVMGEPLPHMAVHP